MIGNYPKILILRQRSKICFYKKSKIRKAKDSAQLHKKYSTRADYYCLFEKGFGHLRNGEIIIGARFADNGRHDTLIQENVLSSESEESVFEIGQFEGIISSIVLLAKPDCFLVADNRGNAVLYGVDQHERVARVKAKIRNLAIGAVYSSSVLGEMVFLGGIDQFQIVLSEQQKVSRVFDSKWAELSTLQACLFEEADKEGKSVVKERLILGSGRTGNLCSNLKFMDLSEVKCSDPNGRGMSNLFSSVHESDSSSANGNCGNHSFKASEDVKMSAKQSRKVENKLEKAEKKIRKLLEKKKKRKNEIQALRSTIEDMRNREKNLEQRERKLEDRENKLKKKERKLKASKLEIKNLLEDLKNESFHKFMQKISVLEKKYGEWQQDSQDFDFDIICADLENTVQPRDENLNSTDLGGAGQMPEDKPQTLAPSVINDQAYSPRSYGRKNQLCVKLGNVRLPEESDLVIFNKTERRDLPKKER